MPVPPLVPPRNAPRSSSHSPSPVFLLCLSCLSRSLLWESFFCKVHKKHLHIFPSTESGHTGQSQSSPSPCSLILTKLSRLLFSRNGPTRHRESWVNQSEDMFRGPEETALLAPLKTQWLPPRNLTLHFQFPFQPLQPLWQEGWWRFKGEKKQFSDTVLQVLLCWAMTLWEKGRNQGLKRKVDRVSV